MAPHRITVLLLATLLAVAGCSAADSGDSSSGNPAAPAQGNGNGQGLQDKGGLAPGNGETDTARQPQSTFALDVDTASYTYALRQINDGRWPEPGTVRAEEFVNAFDPGYPQPRGDGFSVNVDGSSFPEQYSEGGDYRLLRIGLATRGEESETRKDARLTFVVDVSGSMAETGRLDLVQDALHTLVDQLRPTDSVAIVSFNDRARVLRAMTRASDAQRLHDAIDGLHAGGSTNLEAGLVMGYQVARDGFRQGLTNRVIILSDGLANVGNTQADPILRKVREEADKEIALLGVGVGSDYGDELMERLADKGDGFVVYVANRAQAREIFVRQLPASLSVRALDAKAQVTFDEGAVISYRLVGYDNRQISASDFRNDRVDGGEIGPGHHVTALYVVQLRPETASSARVAQVRVRWLDPTSREANEAYESVNVSDISGRFASSDPYLRVAYAAAFFAEALKGGAYGRVPLRELLRVAEDADASLNDRKVTELANAIAAAARLRG
jgi:Ca-activated chloride channel family protein